MSVQSGLQSPEDDQQLQQTPITQLMLMIPNVLLSESEPAHL